MPSKLEKNIARQPELIREILRAERPSWLDERRGKRVFFIGIGTSFYAAQIALWLWRRYVSPDAEAVHSFDFVRDRQNLRSGDAAVLFSHSGTKSFTTQAARLAKERGALTVGITCREGPWREGLDHRLETCEREDIGVFTKSLTSALAWIARWIGDPGLCEAFESAARRLGDGPQFPALRRDTDLILLGDGVREWAAREIALKTQEAAWLRSRAFGLEEFLHGPRISAGPGSLVVAFSGPEEPRWEAARRFVKTIEVPWLEAQAGDFGVPEPAGWLWQIFWGQRLTLDACRRTGADPDLLRAEDPRYKLGRDELVL